MVAMTTRNARPGDFPAAILLAICMALVPPAMAQAQILCRISTENPSSHFQARALKSFADMLGQRIGPKIKIEFYDGATLYRDANALGALSRGDLEIAAPGIWQYDKIVPDTVALMLPAVYAQDRQSIRSMVDGELGSALSSAIESSTRTVVLGSWLDLGYGHLFSLRGRIRTIADIRGKRVRVAGGRGNEERIRALGGIPIAIPLADLPAFIEQDMVDAILSTYETIDSARLDALGLRTVLEDREYYPFYVPLVSRQFWDRLDSTQQLIFRKTWADVVAIYRDEAVKAQDAARRNLLERGMVVHAPTDQELASTRELLIAKQDEIAARLNISPPLLALLEGATRAGSSR